MLAAVNFHYIRPTYDFPHAGIHGITPQDLERQLEVLSRLGSFVGHADIEQALSKGEPLPVNSILVTFDDGLREHYEFAMPLLKKIGIPALFYPSTAPLAENKILSVHQIHLLRAYKGDQWFTESLLRNAKVREINIENLADTQSQVPHYRYDSPEVARLKYFLNFALSPEHKEILADLCFQEAFGDSRNIVQEFYMSTEQLKALSREQAIGTHTHSHFSLGTLSFEKFEQEVALSLAHLKNWIGYSPTSLSYPFGSKLACPEGILKIADRLGIKFALTSERAVNQDLSHPFHLARFDCNDVPGGKCWQGDADAFWKTAAVRQWYLEKGKA